MERLTIDDLEDWFLSGKPVVRFAGRDFDQTVDEYMEWLRDIGKTCNLGVAVRKVLDPPAVVVQTYLPSDEVPELRDPLIKVTKAAHPWLHCVFPKCRIRVPVPGMSCKTHGG